MNTLVESTLATRVGLGVVGAEGGRTSVRYEYGTGRKMVDDWRLDFVHVYGWMSYPTPSSTYIYISTYIFTFWIYIFIYTDRYTIYFISNSSQLLDTFVLNSLSLTHKQKNDDGWKPTKQITYIFVWYSVALWWSVINVFDGWRSLVYVNYIE